MTALTLPPSSGVAPEPLRPPLKWATRKCRKASALPARMGSRASSGTPEKSALIVRPEVGQSAPTWGYSLDHIMRSGATGDWRHWFTPEDIDVYGPLVARYMERFGYDDWSLAAEPVIASETASGYIEGKYHRRRQQQRRRRGLMSDADTTAQREHVEHLAADGHSQSMYRLAEASASSAGDPARAFRMAHRAAVQGHKPAMRLLAELYRRGAGVEVDERAAAFWAAEGDGRQPQPTGGLRRLLSRR